MDEAGVWLAKAAIAELITSYALLNGTAGGPPQDGAYSSDAGVSTSVRGVKMREVGRA
jgi:hypothetical protein